ncbi:hypothetical protein [Methylobacterium sp. WL8]|uniref:hypothetical protein n=1 Tax=Methylobacterium sp. WL8 TaxID=2603899 RepID=UPI0011C97B00|nr:hypothetical protein [Methylobacterium sp. WL8]TXN75550.1 hypothetical protein FV234_24975 [Methylobacterium sp. WL8]
MTNHSRFAALWLCVLLPATASALDRAQPRQKIGPVDILGSVTVAGTSFAPHASIGKSFTDPTSNWVNDNLPGAYSPNRVQQFVISPNGGFSAVVHAARTSDNQGAIDNVLSDTCLSVHDNPTVAHLNWCRYTQVNLKPGAALSLALGEESSVENRWGTPIKMDPFGNFNPGGKDIAGLRINAIGQFNNGLTYYPISSYLEFTYNAQRALNGITFEQESIADNGRGTKDAIVLGINHALQWYGGPAKPSWRLFSNAQTGTGQIIMGDNKFDIFIGSSGENPVSIAPNNVTINDKLNVNGVVQLTGYKVSALPDCTNNNTGSFAFVTDASSSSPIYYSSVSGGGSTRIPVFCTGAAWVYH